MRSSIIWRAGLAAMLCPVLCGSAYAHAFLKSAVPASGSTLKTSPGEVDITFTENVEPRFSHVVVQDATGTAVNAGAIRLAAGNPAQLIAPLKTIGAGTYKVIWHAVSVDAHKTSGSFMFTVAP